jgi:hypothetical protein
MPAVAKLTGRVFDAATGEGLEARVQVVGPNGTTLAPADAMWKVGPGEPFFYSDGQFSLDVPRGLVRVVVERGTEFVPWRHDVEATKSGAIALDVPLERWSDLPERGWHPGNTHIHYDEKEKDPDRRLRYDSRVEGLRMTAVSILKRWDLLYATNKYPPGVMNEYTDTHHYVQCGEETRHNAGGPFSPGYGHVMLLNIRNAVEPLSRGLLVDAFDPDYPPLSYACDDARRQGGIVIWCHNGQGMEAPVAAALGKVDAMNLFDPYWNDTEYDLWYAMLNCGIRLPASTGSDWFVCSANRVYAHGGTRFEYEPWLKAVRDGRTFITNGPALYMTVNEVGPGSTVAAKPGDEVDVELEWQSHYAVDRVEIVLNGRVVAARALAQVSAGHDAARLRARPRARSRTEESGPHAGSARFAVPVRSDGWIAARLAGSARDSFNQAIWAHTSPVYVTIGRGSGPERRASARFFVARLDEAMGWANTGAKFYTDAQRKEVQDLFRAGREYYRKLSR